MNREYSKTGEWCTRNGIICDNHISTADGLTLNNGESCMNRFYGYCNQGTCYIPSSADPGHKLATIKSCREDYTARGAYLDYAPLIGQTFCIKSEFATDILIEVNRRLIQVSMQDCEIKMIPRKKACVQNRLNWKQHNEITI